MPNDSQDKERKKIEIADLSTRVAESIPVLNDKEGRIIRKSTGSSKKRIPIDNVKKK